jgi:hypothetical protein
MRFQLTALSIIMKKIPRLLGFVCIGRLNVAESLLSLSTPRGHPIPAQNSQLLLSISSDDISAGAENTSA